MLRRPTHPPTSMKTLLSDITNRPGLALLAAVTATAAAPSEGPAKLRSRPKRGRQCRSVLNHSLPGFVRVLAFLISLLVATNVFGQEPPTITIDSVTPGGPWFPGDGLNLAVKVTYANAPFPGRVDFVVREVAEAGTKEAVQPASRNVSINLSERNATKTLAFPGYVVPRHSCMDAPSTTTPRCPATMADTVTRLSKIQIVARLFAGAGTEPVATASRDIDDLTYPEIASLSVATQPLNTERLQRVVVNDAKFTQATGIGLAFHKAGAADIAIYGFGSPNGFNQACKPPDAFAEFVLGICNFRVVNDTTIEFALRTFFDPTSPPGMPEPDSAFETFFGAYDLLVSWNEPAPSADHSAHPTRCCSALTPSRRRRKTTWSKLRSSR